MTSSDDLARMMGKFRGNIDFSDSPSGFYGFVRETFEQLAKEEAYTAVYEDLDIPEYPTFGHKDDKYDDVVRNFYSVWNGFATVKSFVWMDVFRLSDAPDRRTRRAMEKENQKLRDDGRRDFNDAVRTLVAFVRKRDPRYKPNIQTADQQAKAQRDATKAQAARARADKIAKLEQEAQALPTWATERPADEEEAGTEEEIEEDHYECVACNKTFKSERQYEAHEKSKKHQKAIQSLKRKMQKDNAHLNLDKDALSSGVMTPAEDDSGPDPAGSDMEVAESVQDLNGKTDELHLDDDSVDEDEDSGSVASDPRTNHGVSSAQKEATSKDDDDEDEDEDDEYASRSTIEARLNALSPSVPSTETPAAESALPISSTADSSDSTPQTPKLGKAKLKKAKKAAKHAEADTSELKSKCLGCDATFASKNQLYQHLQDQPKHAALKSVAGGKGKKRRA
jgi:DnaJ family protein A protein 5